MDTKSKVVGMITIPIYTNEESRLKTKIKLGIPLTDIDYHALAADILKVTGSKSLPDFEDRDLRLYLDKKYPNWKIDSNLTSKLQQMVNHGI